MKVSSSLPTSHDPCSRLGPLQVYVSCPGVMSALYSFKALRLQLTRESDCTGRVTQRHPLVQLMLACSPCPPRALAQEAMTQCCVSLALGQAGNKQPWLPGPGLLHLHWETLDFFFLSKALRFRPSNHELYTGHSGPAAQEDWPGAGWCWEPG